MITLTKEWLMKTIAELEEERDATPGAVNENAANALAAMKLALASLEAKPIGAFHISDQQVGGTTDYIKDGEWPIDDGVIEVYAAPPVPVVPDEKPVPNPLKMYAVDAVAAIAEVRGWNACRAAMLQGADGNSPVIPDGWVACSERLPESKPGSYEYLVFESLNNGVHHDYWNVPDAGDDCQFTPFWNHYDRYVTHWMALPAAPQHEVKP
jgi:hypothetical protein